MKKEVTTDALVTFRPFLSYNELGSLLDEGPSKLYDALSSILGLEDLVEAWNGGADLAPGKFDHDDDGNGHRDEGPGKKDQRPQHCRCDAGPADTGFGGLAHCA